MATVVETDVKLDTSEFEEGIEKMKEGMDDVKNKAEETAEESKKDWGALGGLFQDFLPRGLQRTIRSFKMTQRSVRQAGRSFKVLRGAIISTGIGALIVALGELIDKWDDVTDWLGITSEAQRQLAEEMQRAEERITEMRATTDMYVRALQDENLALSEQKEILDMLSRSVASVKDINLEDADARERVNAAVERQNALFAIQEELKAKQQVMNDILKRQAEAELGWIAIGYSEKQKLKLQDEQRAEIQETEVIPLQEEMNALLADQAKILADLAQEQEDARKAAEDAAKAERERTEQERERERQRKVDAAAIAEYEKIEQQAMMTTLEVELDNLKRREEAELATVKSEEARTAVIAKYAKERSDIYAREADAYEQGLQDMAQARLEDQQTLEDELFMLEQDEFERREVLAMQLFERRMAMAEGNAQQEAEVTRLLNEEMAQIEADRIQHGLDLDAEAEARRQADLDKTKADEQELYDTRIDMYQGIMGALGQVQGLMDENSKAARALAVADILANQAVAISAGIRGAAEAAAKGGPLAPFLLGGFIASMVGSIVSGFKQVKQIMAQADEPMNMDDSVPRPEGRGLVPTVGFNPFQQQTAPTLNARTYLVQSDLQGAMSEYDRATSFATLGGG
jgi:hypothetical protein